MQAKTKWNSRHCELAWKRLENFNKNCADISHPYLDKICKKTKSSRILKLIEEAYYLGWARGILQVNSGMNVIKCNDDFEVINEK